MFPMIKFDLKKGEPKLSISFFGGMRVRYHVMLLDPKGSGGILKEWRGNNWDKVKDDFALSFSGKSLKFAPLSWQFDIFPNPNIPGERYRIIPIITQSGKQIFSREYDNGITQPEIITDDAVFVPNA